MNKIFLEHKIIRLCAQPRTFSFLCENMDGLDPIQLRNALKDLVDARHIQQKQDLWVKRENGNTPTLEFMPTDHQLYLKKYMGYFDFLKTPHPLDFEWRNSTASLHYLTALIQQLNAVGDNILYLGMPTLFATAVMKDIPHKVTLVERNKPIVQALSNLTRDQDRFKVRELDIFKTDQKKVGLHHCVVMDPPWYTQFFEQFMWLAAQTVEVGGLVAISMPSLNTKDDILDQRMDWLKFCHSQGLCLEELRPQQLRYAMPFFEFNALRAAGIEGFTPFWRKGDLAVFRKICERKTARPSLPPSDSEWDEIEIDTVRIRVKRGENKANGPLKIQNILKGNILPTVSKSDERRKDANIWTSGNRIYQVNDPETFFKLLGEVKEGKKFHTKNERVVSDFVEQVTSVEMGEYSDYLDWLYHEMERQID